MQYTNYYHSPIGDITLASNGDKLTGLWFNNQKYYANTLTLEHEEKNLPIFDQTKKWLDIYFHKKEPNFTPPLYLNASPFRLAVWEILRAIPYGKTITYGEIAKKIAIQQKVKSMSAQAVGGAVGHNPISIIIPCHRVIGTNGSLIGYAGGIDKKISLLLLEGLDMKKLVITKKDMSL